jgi:parallel beta-helix repeat protein
MKRKDQLNKITALISTVFLVSIYLSNLFLLPSVQAAGINNINYIPDQYSFLQDAINNSVDGDIIQINSSITVINTIQINKSITLQGTASSNPSIFGISNNSINITVNNVTIQNLTFSNFSTAIIILNQSLPLQNITIQNVTIENNSQYGLSITNALNSSIINCEIKNCSQMGINLTNSSNNTIRNTIINQTQIALSVLSLSNNNTIRNNTFTNNIIGINISTSSNNSLYYNIFIDNTNHVRDSGTNNWDNGTFGNYWDNYTGTDSDNDGIGDTIYEIPYGSNQDDYPLGYFVPIINFTYTPSNPSTNDTIQFIDNSTDPNNESLNYSWNFNDGNISYEQNPTHNYSDNKTYNVSLTVTNTYNQTNQTYQNIQVSNTAPSVTLNILPSVGIVNETISFKVNATDIDGTIINWTWTFDDGTFSYIKNTSHSYSQNGSYTISLNATDNDGNYTNESQTISVTYKPIVNFSYSPLLPKTNQTITFTDTSTDIDSTISSWSWSFGDGGTSTSQNPTHAFTTNGNFNIILNVTDSHGATNQTTKSISISNTNPKANFSYTPHNPTDVQTITFTDNSTDTDGTLVNWTWTFGDGNTNYSQNTSHQFQDNGTYTITLNVTDNDGGTNQTSISITVLNVEPSADYTYEPKYPSIGEIIWFNDTSVDQDGSIVNWTWVLASGQTNYTQNLTYAYTTFQSRNVTLTITDDDENTSTKTKQIIMKKTYTKEIPDDALQTYDLIDECDTYFKLKTSQDTNASVIVYSSTPTEIDDTISSYINLKSYVNITLDNDSALDWINLTLYYTSNEITNNDIDESSLKIFYWNETDEEWVAINGIINTVDSDDYGGYVSVNITHLTFFTLAGKLNEEQEEIEYVLPTITSSSNNTVFHSSKPIFNITYNRKAMIESATVSGIAVDYTTIDNLTFLFYLNITRNNGNYSLKVSIKNETSVRTDEFFYSINITNSQSSDSTFTIPLWILYSFIVIILLVFIYIANKKVQFIHILINGLISINPKKSFPLTNTTNKEIQYNEKTSYHKLFKISKSLHLPSIDDNDPWEKACSQTQGLLHNIDLFIEKPDAYVVIQEKLISEDENCKRIFDLIYKNNLSANDLKKKTNLPDEELFKSISILIKYGILQMNAEELFEISFQAKQIKNK